MDKRFALELFPAVAFLVGNAVGGLFVAAGAASVMTALAVALRWHWDRSLPWLALATFALALVLLLAGLVFNDTTFIKVRSTIGSVAFAIIVMAGTLLRPSLLRRTLGYRLRMTGRGWRVLHGAWIALALLSAAANEVVWRNTSDDTWATYNAMSGFALFGLYYAVTSIVAHRHWQDAA